MGFIKPEVKQEIPKGTEYLWQLYKDIRFSLTEDNKLMPRSELTFADLNEYKQAMQFDLSATEASVIMRADAVFNKSTQ
ncbi:hypothetical protein N9878_02325 [bacterium]|nr:hypothetical protein [bacterium]